MCCQTEGKIKWNLQSETIETARDSRDSISRPKSYTFKEEQYKVELNLKSDKVVVETKRGEIKWRGATNCNWLLAPTWQEWDGSKNWDKDTAAKMP